MKEKDEKIKELESRVALLESANDSIEQYSRRSNLRIEGIPENVGTGEIENAILDIVNDHMKLTPVLQSHEIERAHRIGRPKTDLTRFNKIAISNNKFQMASGQGSHWLIESPTIFSSMCSPPLSDICQFYF